MLSSRKWNDGRHWRRFAALFSCSFLIICFMIHKAKGESSMLSSFISICPEQKGTDNFATAVSKALIADAPNL